MSKELTNLEKDLKLVDVVNNEIVVSSRQVAEHFGKEHKNVLASISDILAAEISATKFYHETTFENRGKQYPMYLMDRDGFSLLVMGFSGKEALKWKIKYIEAFNSMEQRLKLIEQQEIGRLIERIKGKEVRRTLTDAIKENIPETPHKRFMYKNFTDLAYKTVFGMNTKQMRYDRGLEKGDSLRDCFNEQELKQVKGAESVIKGFLDMGYSYSDVKDILAKKYIS